MNDFIQAVDALKAHMGANHGVGDKCQIVGRYSITCHDADGVELWHEEFDNLVPTVGLDQIAASGVFGSAPLYMGLMGGSSATPAATDTMASHSGWVEASSTNEPGYGTTRPTLTFATPSGGATSTSSTNSFTFAASGSVQGAFIVFGPSASATVGSTTGVLMSAGTLGTAQPVISGNVVTMSYTLTM